MNRLTKLMFKIGLRINFIGLTPIFKYAASIIRYKTNIYLNRNDSNKKNIILICGLPKSGTTWLESLLSVNGKFTNLLPPDLTKWEQRYGRSDNYIPSNDIFNKIPNGNWVIKIHAAPSDELIQLLKTHQLKPIIIYRDIEDVLDSHKHYVLKTKFHPEYFELKNKKESEVSNLLKKRYYEDFNQWVSNWNELNIQKYILTYESLLENTEKLLKEIFEFLSIEVDDNELLKIIDSNSIENMRKKAVQKAFFRGKYKTK